MLPFLRELKELNTTENTKPFGSVVLFKFIIIGSPRIGELIACQEPVRIRSRRNQWLRISQERFHLHMSLIQLRPLVGEAGISIEDDWNRVPNRTIIGRVNFFTGSGLERQYQGATLALAANCQSSLLRFLLSSIGPWIFPLNRA